MAGIIEREDAEIAVIYQKNLLCLYVTNELKC